MTVITVKQPVTRVDVRPGSGGSPGPKGDPGPGVPAGGGDGDVVVKDGSDPYEYTTLGKGDFVQLVRSNIRDLGTTVYVDDFGAVGGVSDDTAAIQDALDHAETLLQHGGAFFPDREPRVVFRPNGYHSVTGISVPQGVVLDLSGGELRALAGTTDLVTLAGDRAGVRNGFLQALIAPTGVTAVRIPSGVFQASVEKVVFNSFGLSAIAVEGNAAWINRCWAQNCLLDAASLSTETGVLHVALTGNDIWVRDSEFCASRTSLSASGKAYGVVVLGKVGVFDGVVGEISDHGWFVSSIGVKMTNCRGDLNRGHGFVFSAGGGSVLGCNALNNGRETTNTYSGFLIKDSGGSAASQQPTYSFDACRADITLGNTHKYGFEATSANNGFYAKLASSCRSAGHGTRAVAVVTAGGALVEPEGGQFTPITAAATSCDVQQWGWPKSNWKLSSVGAVNFVTFSNPVPGMRLSVIGDGFSTFLHNTAGGFDMRDNANLLALAGEIYQFQWSGSAWVEVGLSPRAPLNAQTGTSYTAVATDNNKLVTMTNASASTFTVPPNSSVAFPVGAKIEVAQMGAGQVTLTPGAGVTINGTPGLKTRAQYSQVTLIKLATDTWLAYDDLAA